MRSGIRCLVSLKFADSGKRGLLTYLENTLHESLTYEPETYEIENSTGTVRYKAFLIACANASQYGNNAYIAPQASLTDGMMDITVLEPFTVLDVPSLSFQLFNRTLDQNSRIKTMKDKSIIIHRAQEGVFHFDGDPMMGGKDLKVEIIHQGLHVIAPIRPKQMPSPPAEHSPALHRLYRTTSHHFGHRPETQATPDAEPSHSETLVEKIIISSYKGQIEISGQITKLRCIDMTLRLDGKVRDFRLRTRMLHERHQHTLGGQFLARMHPGLA